MGLSVMVLVLVLVLVLVKRWMVNYKTGQSSIVAFRERAIR
jgi:hypothetical protein